LKIAVSPHARKGLDAFANLKSANFLPYVMASIYAQQNGWDDALVLNSANAIADSCRANIFLARNNELFTPALHQGCINGVMRRFLVDWCKKQGFIVRQEEITEADLLNADEVFLTNAIYGIRWVRQFREKQYTFDLTRNIYLQSLSTIYS
jgi:branched-chain amino acid aminotransferase